MDATADNADRVPAFASRGQKHSTFKHSTFTLNHGSRWTFTNHGTLP
jgi:hypothetical protein